MITALALRECVPSGSPTRPERKQGAVTVQFWISSPFVDSAFSISQSCFLLFPPSGLVTLLTKSLCDF